MRGRCRHRQDAGLPRGLYPVADEPPRPDETAYRYLHFQRCLQDAIINDYLPNLSAILLEEGIIQAPLTAVIRKGKERFVCDARLVERASLVQPPENGKGTACALLSKFWTWIISRNFPAMTAAGFVCRSPARAIAFCARIAATSNICGIL